MSRERPFKCLDRSNTNSLPTYLKLKMSDVGQFLLPFEDACTTPHSFHHDLGCELNVIESRKGRLIVMFSKIGPHC